MQTEFIGESPAIIKIKEMIELISGTDLNVIVTGETGVGKEVVARVLYEKSPRCKNTFIKVNCAALPEGLLESELYGYEQGAFTGADKKKKGKFELAHKGVLFLDEIGDMSLQLQAKLLHVLQSGEFAPLGAEKELKSDTWVVAATNHDLESSINSNEFRADLYYRLNTINIHIPPLRERKEDIPRLIEYYKSIFVSQNNIKTNNLDEETIKNLTAYHWPGNVRQLQNIVKKILILGNGSNISGDLLSQNTEFGNISPSIEAKREVETPNSNIINDITDLNSPSFSLKNIRKKALDKIEHETISHVLKKTSWNRSKAATILKISYKTLLYKISDLNIKPDDEE